MKLVVKHVHNEEDFCDNRQVTSVKQETKCYHLKHTKHGNPQLDRGCS